MRRGGRARTSYIYTRLFCACASIAIARAIKYGVPIEINHWDTGKSPLKRMVDVTNSFGLKVLAEHNFLNDNNIAFSPYGLMGIMVALYEGVDGHSSYQIQRAMQLPWNRNVMRIGFRDIHRSLKTYFVPEEGFLAGLALNNENITFNENYIKILRFYGFDLENEKPITSTPGSSSTTNVSETPTNTTNDVVSSTTDMTTLTTSLTQELTTVLSEVTTDTDLATVSSTVDPTTSLNNQAASTIAETTLTTSSVTETSITPRPGTDFTQETTTVSSVLSTITEIATASNTIESTTSLDNQTDSTEAKTIQTAETNIVTSTETTSTIASYTVASTTEITPTTAASTINRELEELTDLPSRTTDETLITTSLTSTMPPIDTTTAITTSTSEGITSTTESMPTSINNIASTSDVGIFTTSTAESFTPTAEIISTIESTTNNAESGSDQSSTPIDDSKLETLQRKKKSIDELLYTQPPYIVDYLRYRSFDVGPELVDAENRGDEIPHSNGLKNSQTTYMNYDTVLEHAFLPHLDASAVRLPLDSARYYLLVVLPNRKRAGEISRLLGRMARLSDLSDVYSSLRPRRVRAVVPSFFVKGRVTLTSDLQRLGIRNVFQPRQNDFTPMTNQTGVYVRNIEQAISVAIRKYSPDETKTDRHVANWHRVYFSATYPFLYFVIDANIHVALMAGKLVDPLNTRIL